MSAIDEIATERRRQIEAEGWTTMHDDQHADGDLARAAAAYAYAGSMSDRSGRNAKQIAELIRVLWPWGWDWWKPKSRRRDLVRAGALIVAEIERLDRARVSHNATMAAALSRGPIKS